VSFATERERSEYEREWGWLVRREEMEGSASVCLTINMRASVGFFFFN
jgi:hypothetical protein